MLRITLLCSLLIAEVGITFDFNRNPDCKMPIVDK